MPRKSGHPRKSRVNTRVSDLASLENASFTTVYDSFQGLMIVIIGFYFTGKSAEVVATANIAAARQSAGTTTTVNGTMANAEANTGPTKPSEPTEGQSPTALAP